MLRKWLGHMETIAKDEMGVQIEHPMDVHVHWPSAECFSGLRRLPQTAVDALRLITGLSASGASPKVFFVTAFADAIRSVL